jgi:hypothetical protein
MARAPTINPKRIVHQPGGAEIAPKSVGPTTDDAAVAVNIMKESISTTGDKAATSLDDKGGAPKPRQKPTSSGLVAEAARIKETLPGFGDEKKIYEMTRPLSRILEL